MVWIYFLNMDKQFLIYFRSTVKHTSSILNAVVNDLLMLCLPSFPQIRIYYQESFGQPRTNYN